MENKKLEFEQFSEMVLRLYPELHEIDGEQKCYSRTVTFQVTDECNLACTYCYQINKGKRVMSLETAKKFVDLLLDATPENNSYINPVISPWIIIDFIGGEPFLALDLIDDIMNYFRDQAFKKQHPWATRYCISICSNGTLYREPKVQQFLNKHKNHLSFSVTIDGNKELHDSCRIFHDGRPSYDIAVDAAQDWMKRGHYMGSKITIAPANITYLYDALVHMVELGYKEINANCVYEKGWEIEHAQELYRQMKRFSDYLLDNDLNIFCSLYEEDFFAPKQEGDDDNWCGGTGMMLSCDPDGYLYPCIRYMESSLGNDQPPIRIGHVDTGLVTTEEEKETVRCLNCVNRRTQSTDECYYCPIAGGCSWCFPAGTKVSTPAGLVDIEKISVGDTVLDMNGVERSVEATTNHIAADLVYVKAAGLPDLLTTYEHPFWCKPVVKRYHNIPVYGEPQWVKAKDLKVSDKIGLFVPKLGNEHVDSELAYLLGRYIGDGWKTPSNREKHPYNYYICCAFDEQDELEKHLNNADILYKKSINKTVVEYYINISGTNNEFLTKLFDKCGRYAIDKKVPREVWSWDRESVEFMLKGYFDADGCIDKKHNIQRFTSVSKELVLNISELIRGVYHKNVNVTCRKVNSTSSIEGRKVNQHDSYEGRYHIGDVDKKYYEYDKESNIMWVNVRKSDRAIPESERVYNISVSANPTFIANGALVHNCSAYNYQEFGTVDKRATYICEMHKARSLANVYYWNKLYQKNKTNKTFKMHCPKEWAIPIIGEDEYEYLLTLGGKTNED